MPEVGVLGNGLTILVLRKPARVVSLALAVRAAGTEVAGKSGLCALTTRMLGEGTTRKTNLELAEAVEALGTSLDTESGHDWARASLDVLTADLGAGMSLLAEIVQSPRFDAKDFERVRGQWLDNLSAELEDPQQIANVVALRTLLGSPTGDPVNGSPKDVKALAIADLTAYHRATFVPKNAALLVTGDMTLAEVRPLAERSFGKWHGTTPPPIPPLPAPSATTKTRVLLVDRPGSVQSVVVSIQPFPRRLDPGHETRDLMSAAVGGLFTSRINQSLRETHAYTYGAFGTAVETSRWGAYVIATSVETPVTGAALEALLKELESVRGGPNGKPVTEPEIVNARSELTSTAAAHLEHTRRLLDDLTTIFVERLPADTYSRYAQMLGLVPREAVAKAASDLLTPDRLLVVVVGDKAQVERDLKAHGFRVELADRALLD